MLRAKPVLHRAALLLALGATLSACDADDITGGGGGGGGRAGEPPTSSSLARFNVELRASGAFRPGTPVQLTMSVRALIPTNDASVDLVLPELAEAEMRGGWERYAPVRGQGLKPLASRRQAIGRGAVTQHQASIVFPRPGYYSVWASATSTDTSVYEGQQVQNAEHKVLYVWISETGGKVMERLDPALIPDESVPGLGPLRRRGAAGAGSAVRASLQTTIPVLVDYWNADASTYTPVPNATYSVQAWSSTGSLLQTLRGQTDANGYINIPCSAGSRFVVSAWAQNGYAAVGSTPSNYRGGEQIVNATYYASTDCGITMYPTAPSDVSHVFNNMTTTAANAYTFFGYTRPVNLPVLLVYSETQPYSSYCPTSGYLGCSSGNDFVRINTYSGSTYGNQVWGSNGVWVQGHEFGHAYHEKALGGYVEQFWRAASCASNHPVTGASKLGCAYPEGFADYFAVATRGDATGYEYGFEISYYYIGQPTRPADGSIVEGAVASLFYDITDANRWGTGTAGGTVDEAHDAVAYPGRLVADMVRTCEVTESGVWKRASGIDHIVHCLEKAVYPAITGSATYFPTRSPDPTAQRSSSSVTWDATQTRKLWLKNLYNRTTL